MKRIEVSLLLASFLTLTPGACGTDRVGDFVNDYLKKKQIPGCAVMVRRSGKVVLSAGYGMANVDLLKMIIAQPLAFAAGEKWNYSNLGYVTLGIQLHRVSGEFYGELLQKRIFGPLGMKHTRIISEADIIPNRAAGYRLKDGVLKNQEWVSPTLNTTADGSLYFTVEDIAKWDEALSAGKLLSHAGFVQMWTPVKLNDGSNAPYGFGWGIQKDSGHRILDHGGAWQGFASYIARYPDDQLSVVTFCNRAGASAGYIAKRIAGFYLPELAPRVHSAVKLNPAILRSYAGEYRLEDRLTIKVTVAGDRLETTWLGQKMAMVPESETAFFEEDSDRTFRFAKDDRDNVTALVISVPEEITLRRLP